MVMAMNSEYRGSASGVAAPKNKAATKKTKVTPGTKVSQKTIDNIKSMGMKNTLEALKSIGQPGSRNVASSKEFIEGARRMYGSRVDKYLPASKPTSSGGGKYVGSRFVANTPAPKKASASRVVYKSADAARAAATKTSTTRMGANTVMAKSTVRTSGAAPKRKPATNPAAKVVVNILSGKGMGNRKQQKLKKIK
jgi:hypothetical protein